MTPDQLRAAAERMVSQWDNHGRYRQIAGEDNSEPAEVSIARAYLAEHDPTPIDETWLRSVGFRDSAHGYALEFKWRKHYGEDVAEFVLSATDKENLPDTTWDISCKSIEVPRESAMLPCEPQTRCELRRLCTALGIELKEQA